MTKSSLQSVLFFGVIVVLFVSTNFVLANGTHGQYFEKDIGKYTIGIGTDVYTFVVGDTVRFDFNLKDNERQEPAEFTDIWVRIIKKEEGVNDKTMFASGLSNPEFGWPGMTFIFPEAGNYEFIVFFNKDGKAITEETIFPLTVENVQSAQGWQKIAIGLVAIIIVGSIVYFFFIKKRSSI